MAKLSSRCSVEGCDKERHARGLCSTHYSYWHRSQNGRKEFPRICDTCGASFVATVPDARYCSTGTDSCESRGKTGINLRTGQPAAPPSSRLARSRLFNLASPCTRSEIAAYKRALRSDPCAYCGSNGGSIDHIVPRSSSRSNDWQQLTGSCHRCNATKQTLSLLLALLWLPVSRSYHDLRPLIFTR